jgi:hypothetical protein
MTQLTLWLMACSVVAVIGLVRPAVPVIISVTVLWVIPSPAAEVITGVPYAESTGSLALHPTTWLLLVAVAVRLAIQPVATVSTAFSRSTVATVALLVAVASAVLSTYSARGAQGFSQLVETIAGPSALLLLCLVAAESDTRFHRTFCTAIQGAALLMAGLAVVQYLVGRDIFFESYYARTAWRQHFELYGYRSPALLDHPLTAGMFFVASMPLMRVRMGPWKSPGAAGLVLLVAGIAATGARAALVVGGLYLLIAYALREEGDRRGLRSRGVIIAPAASYFLLMTTPIGAAILRRFATDTSSYDIRTSAFRAFWSQWQSFVFSGTGVGGSATLSQQLLHRSTSFENAAIMLAADIGIIPTLLLYVSILKFASGDQFALRNRPQHGVWLALIMGLTFSSYGTKSVAGYIVWMCVALSATAPHTGRVQADRTPGHSGVDAERGVLPPRGRIDDFLTPEHLH